jgi:formylglycine-generating enzyme required for sulfatase activity
MCGTIAAAGVAQAAPAVVLASPECSGPVTEAAAEVFYQSLTRELRTGAVRVIERREYARLLAERDVALATAPDEANRLYILAARKLQATSVLVPTVCKIEQDYILSVRLIDIKTELTRACSVRRTRIEAKFADQSVELLKEVVFAAPDRQAAPDASPTGAGAQTQPAGETGAETAAGEEPSEPQQSDDDKRLLALIAELRDQCLSIRAEAMFPAWWDRTEKLRTSSRGKLPLAHLASYYVRLLQLSARALTPPEGMVFVPGGYVAMPTSAGERKLWVGPFFIDRCETSAGEFAEFLRSLEATAEGRARIRAFTPIVRGAAAMPVAGVSQEAAEAYAAFRGKELPTALQWVRAAAGDDARVYPCGKEDALKGCRLKGTTLAEAAKPGEDVSPWGVLGMTGNVREWTSSWYAKDSYATTPADAPQEPAQGTLKMVAGGGFRSLPAQAACRQFERYGPREALDDVGLRCVMSFTLPSARIPAPTSQENKFPEEK